MLIPNFVPNFKFKIIYRLLIMKGIYMSFSEPHSELLIVFRGRKEEKRCRKLLNLGPIVAFSCRLYLFSAAVPDLVHHVSGLVKQQSLVLP